MPISREEFSQGRFDFTVHVLDAFAMWQDRALNFNDLKEHVAFALGGLVPNEQDLALILRTLEVGGTLSTNEVGGIRYWIYNSDTG